MDREIWRTTVHMVAESDKTEKSLERHYIKITGYTLKCVNFMVHKLYLNNIVLKIKCSHCVLSCVNLWCLKYLGISYTATDPEDPLFIPAETEALVTQSCPTLCDFKHYSPPGSSVHGIFQARILEWVVIPFL